MLGWVDFTGRNTVTPKKHSKILAVVEKMFGVLISYQPRYIMENSDETFFTI